MRGFARISGILCVLGVAACAVNPDSSVSSQTSAVSEIAPGSPEEAAVLALCNDPVVDQPLLDDDVGLDVRAATNIIAHRDGEDAVVGSADDDLYDSIDELDAIPYVGESALAKLLEYAKSHGYMAGTTAPTEEELQYATLALANDRAVDQAMLDDEVGLDSRAASNIVEFRNGVDGVEGTPDDRTFMNIAALDDISYVGDTALSHLRDYAVNHGYLDQVPTAQSQAIFSPKPYYQSHVTEIAERIDAAESSIDIAMYSFSDAQIFDALAAAVERGVSVRFIFETASEDRKLTGSALAASKSARLEAIGINVRWVNKIMHHKFAIIDGPRTDLGAAASALCITGSGNWSYGAASTYDENTLFLQGHTEIALRLQREFNLMWDHSRDFVFDPNLPVPPAIDIDESSVADDSSTHAYFTSDNFKVSGDTFSIVSGRNTIADAMVAAIANATDSIWIASGHLRSRPVAEALMAKIAASPTIDIRVYLDDQEYISSWFHAQQLAELEDCLADASTVSQERICLDKGFLFGYEVGEAGVDVRYKFYAFRWDYSYAAQMHNKFMIVDGDELWTGSYNLSDNAEHNTFENMLVFRGLPHAKLIAAYEAHFQTIWETRRNDGSYAELLDEIENASVIPLVFDPMALNWSEVEALKSAIVSNCPDVYSDEYEDDPAGHQICPR